MGRREDEGETRQTKLPGTAGSPDDQATGHIVDLGAVAELRAALGAGAEKHTLPLYGLPDQIVVGRGTACDWQIDHHSLSRKHAQFRWNGRELTVEDLGSANGTRVNGRPARGPTPVNPGEPVQLGTVIITLEPKGSTPRPATDEAATRLVAQPDLRSEDSLISDPGLSPIPAAPTVVRTPAPRPSGGGAKQNAAVFRPQKDAANPDESTRSWDPRAALVKAPEKAFDGELLEQLKTLWREKRRLVVLAGASAWIAVLLIIWSAAERRQMEDETPQLPTVSAPRKPIVTQLDPPRPPETPAADDAEREEILAQAVAAYEQGRTAEALAHFKRLAADPKDTAAQFMVDLLASKKGTTP
jgi:pSer/pThr/pTyr-binding forkhead associated (FHA) protein